MPITLLLFCSLAAEELRRPVVKVPGIGALRGSGEGAVESFLGIPYASPPVGKGRWQAPGQQPSWTGVREANEYGATCMGSKCGCSFTDPQCDWKQDSEDCLFLNVYRPAWAKRTKRMPVMVYIHGGAFTTGCSQMYPGMAMVSAAQEAVIVVSLNYRLNVFGFLGSDRLRAADGSTGNFGFQDQRAALRWVLQNIGAFGGDTRRITIFGESAGAGSVAAHIVSQQSWPLYDHAIAESGAGAIWNMKSVDAAESAFDTVLSMASCTSVKCLRHADASDIGAVADAVQPGGPAPGYSQWSPVVDGVEFTDTVWKLAEQGHVKKHSTVLGTCRDEGAFFNILGKKPMNMTEAEFDTDVRSQILGENSSLSTLKEVKKLYAEDNYPYPKQRGDYSKWWWALEAIVTDRDFACPNRRFARSLTRAGAEVYNYFFVHPVQTKIPFLISAGPGNILVPHGTELPFVFACGISMFNATDVDCEFTGEGERSLAGEVINAWVSVAATGSPGTVGGSRWVKWPKSPSTPYERTSLQFDVSTEARGTGIQRGGPAIDKQCDFLDARMF